MPRYYVTRSGAEKLQAKKQELQQKLKKTQGQKGEAAEVGGNVWHDNFSFEQLGRDEQMLNKQITDLNAILVSLVIVDMPKDCSVLTIGHIARLNVDGQPKTIIVGGFNEGDTNADPPVLSYTAPLVAPFTGQEVGHEATIDLPGGKKVVVLESIELQQRPR